MPEFGSFLPKTERPKQTASTPLPQRLLDWARSIPKSQEIKKLETVLGRYESSVDSYGDTDYMTGFLQGHRTASILTPAHHIYSGGWFAQLGRGECLPHAYANAGLAIDALPHPQFITSLLEKAKGGGPDGKSSGLTLKQLLEAKMSDPRSVNVKLKGFTVGNDYQELAKTLTENIARKSSFIVSVNAGVLTGEKPETSHATAVTGFRVNDQGNVDVQIVDSGIGKFFTSLEHLQESLLSPLIIRVSEVGNADIAYLDQNASSLK